MASAPVQSAILVSKRLLACAGRCSSVSLDVPKSKTLRASWSTAAVSWHAGHSSMRLATSTVRWCTAICDAMQNWAISACECTSWPWPPILRAAENATALVRASAASHSKMACVWRTPSPSIKSSGHIHDASARRSRSGNAASSLGISVEGATAAEMVRGESGAATYTEHTRPSFGRDDRFLPVRNYDSRLVLRVDVACYLLFSRIARTLGNAEPSGPVEWM